jgi:2-hydroxychromene-2-carboxylate isomerase
MAGAPRFFVDGEELLAAAGTPELKTALKERTDAAIALGVRGVPTVLVGNEAFWGDDHLKDAAREHCGSDRG